MSPILGWSLAFVVIAVVVVAAAVYMSQPKGGSGALTAPSVVTPANIASSGRTLGNANAPVTVDLYGDFRCSACREFTFGGMETSLITDYIATGRARLVWHDRLIIDDVRGGPASRDAANAAYCAADQGKFWTMHDWLYANQASDESASAFSAARLSEIGKAAGLDMAQLQPCLDAGTHSADISSQSAAIKNTITSTPTVYVNGKAVSAPDQGVSYSQIKAAIDAAPASPAP
jgi:protein-disulfide isomerase